MAAIGNGCDWSLVSHGFCEGSSLAMKSKREHMPSCDRIKWQFFGRSEISIVD